LIATLLKQLGVETGSIVEFGNTEALKQAAIHGGGIAWLPTISVSSELQDGRLVKLPVRALALQRPLSIIRREGAWQAPAVDAFLKLLR